MANVGGGVHRGPGLPGAGRQCGICGTLISQPGPCPVCHDDPRWRPPQRPSGPQQARQAMQTLQPPAEPEAEPVTLELRLTLTTVPDGETQVWLHATSGEAYTGEGATLQEAVLGAVQALEEDLMTPRCPTCGQRWAGSMEGVER